MLIVAGICLQIPVWAQGNSTSSPYSRYGYGMLADQSSAMGHAMGGIGYGLRNSNQINTMNPASYSAVDSLTFLFDMGVDFKISWMKEGVNKQKDYNGDLKNINMLFPIAKNFAFSAGFIPFSYVGYQYGIQYDSQTQAQTNYSGNGGFHQVYGGLAYKYGNFSVGTNIGYLFGDLEHYTYTYPQGGSTGVYQDSIKVRAHDFIYTIGAQQKIVLPDNKHLVLGAAYTPKLKMTAKGTETRWIGSEKIRDTITSANEFDLAQKLGVGVSFVSNKWTVGADVQWENWADAKINNQTDSLNNRLRYGVGAEMIPNARSRNFFGRTKYRFGGYYTNSYITTDAGSTYDEFGLSVGLGMPVYNKSVLHVSFDYVNIMPSIKNTLSENYFKITLNYTFNETWFRKWRIQ